MRKERGYVSYMIGGSLLLMLILPVALSSHLRSTVFSFLTPIWALMQNNNSGEIARLESRILELESERAVWSPDPTINPVGKEIISAKVIFRSHAAWKSYLWLNKGDLDAPFNLLNAPVLKGDILIGVIDEVKPHASKVRLISDPTLTPSVRVIREGRYLAKGELNGSLKPSYRKGGLSLKGTGFNYDFPDDEGNPIDLREDIVKPGDTLITTGFDGVFPKGLKVAEVLKVQPLKEGDFYYNLEAKSLGGSLNNLEHLQIIPPMPSF